MSDFSYEFFNWYVTLIVLISIVACAVFLWVQSSARPGSGSTSGKDGHAGTTGHVWDETLEEYNNPLPRWWMWLFYGTVVFALIYVFLYPALGRFPGLYGWTSAGEYEQEISIAEATTKPLFEKYLKTDLKTLADDKPAMEMAGRLYQTYCMQCHGGTGKGSPGYPNLTDKDWLWGGEPEQIVASISEGRVGVMPPYGGNPEAIGDASGVKETVSYVRSLSGLSHDSDLAAKGKVRYEAICIACHGADGKGNIALGAPNLTDKIWLYGSSQARISEGIINGRMNQMPAWKDFLGEEKIHLLAAYVLNLSAGGQTK